MAEHLYDNWPRHWTGRVHAMSGMIRIDGKAYRFMGKAPDAPDAMRQTWCFVAATQTTYTFRAGGVELALFFISSLLPDDLELLSRPATYVMFQASATDDKPHDIQLYFDATAEWAVDDVKQQVQWKRLNVPGLHAMAIGSVEQKVLGRKGDDVRIDWGQLLMGVPQQSMARTSAAIGNSEAMRAGFVKDGSLPENDDADMPRAANDRWPALAAVFNLGKLDTIARCNFIIGYDDEYSIEYFGRKLRPWWRRDGKATAETMLAAADKDYGDVYAKSRKFDVSLAMSAQRAGGAKYAELCVTAYRQAVAAHKLVADVDGKPLFFSKENFSNGSIGTVDVTYPSAPLFLVYNPTLLKGMMEPIFYFRESGKWTKPFAAHDVGTYPLANGQTYGGDMPVEECGNMLILAAAIAKAEGNADFAKKHWESLTEWAKYLEKAGFDPENQLCTDDFAGHLAHNANLSIKAIVALGGYGKMAGMLGDPAAEKKYIDLARELAGKWAEAAGDGDHFVLAFDKKGTWSQKYNLVWDKVLGLNLFRPEVARREVAFYLTKQNTFGLPLDSRKTYTKSDWIIWTATLAEKPEDFQAIVAPVWKYVNETADRIPISDWHETTNGKSVGFRARSVVGGFFMKMLAEGK